MPSKILDSNRGDNGKWKVTTGKGGKLPPYFTLLKKWENWKVGKWGEMKRKCISDKCSVIQTDRKVFLKVIVFAVR